MQTERITITSPTAGSVKVKSVFINFHGRLTGIEVFVDTPDANDAVSLALRDRMIVQRLFVDLSSKTSYEKKLDEEVFPGDTLTLYYQNAGTSSKTVSWTPELRQFDEPEASQPGLTPKEALARAGA